jgi:uncharacterized membrane protein YtjA (UPF0391 family)
MPRDPLGRTSDAAADGGSIPYRIPPPPPPVPFVRIISIVFAIVAVIAGLAGFSRTAGVSAAISLIFNLVDLFAQRGVVQIPRSALDAEGKLQVEKRG